MEKKEKLGEIIYKTTVEEIFDVQVLPNMVNPGLINTYDERHKMAITTKGKSFWRTN